MPKRTSNSSVNSSIRQQTKSNEEGLGNLLELQKASLGELSSIRQLLQLSREYQKNQQVSSGNADVVKLQMDMMQTMKEHASSSKRYYKTSEDHFKKDQASWDNEAKKLAELSKTMNTTGNIFQEMRKSSKERTKSAVESVKDGGLKRSVMGALNVGGIFNKSIAKSQWMSQQKAMGFKPTKDDAEGAYKASKDMKAHEAEIAKFQKKTGISNEEEMRKTPTGSKLLDKRISLGEQMTKFDMGAQRFDPTVKGMVNPEAANKTPSGIAPAVVNKTPTASAAKEAQSEEVQLEGMRSQQAMSDVLKKIEENTRAGVGKGGATPEKVKPAEGGGLLDSIFGWIGDNFMGIIKKIFSPKNLLKTLGKVFAIGALIGAIWEGLTDGFDEFMKTGDIGKAIVAGLAGIVDFLTFGLFDKEKIKEVIGDMATWIDDHIVKPVSSFFGAMKDSFLSLVSKIGIPEIDISSFTKYIPKAPDKIGPFYPFADAAPKAKTPEAPAPTAATAVEQKSADNAAAAVPESGGGNKTSVVNAPVTNNTTQNQVIRAPIRNQDSSAGSYMRSRYA
jgi:hypothetical protein